ncbi:LysR substrate-binding domain-containing protein [Micromonospora sp. NPDC048930]|uniref:LysR substrate-binding domain-containing protein n=1 Tax=Micromonospora sp. NPDC048930 TaxID=3364261 RepID=UPI0037196A97
MAVPGTHRLAHRRTVRLHELADDPFIAGSATAEETLLRATLPAGFRPRIDIVAAEWTGKLGCVAAGLGVALVPALAVRATPPDLALGSPPRHHGQPVRKQTHVALPARGNDVRKWDVQRGGLHVEGVRSK